MTNQISDAERDDRNAAARSHRVTAAAWLAGITAVVDLTTLSGEATIGAALGVIGVSAMVAVVCYFI